MVPGTRRQRRGRQTPGRRSLHRKGARSLPAPPAHQQLELRHPDGEAQQCLFIHKGQAAGGSRQRRHGGRRRVERGDGANAGACCLRAIDTARLLGALNASKQELTDDRNEELGCGVPAVSLLCSALTGQVAAAVGVE